MPSECSIIVTATVVVINTELRGKKGALALPAGRIAAALCSGGEEEKLTPSAGWPVGRQAWAVGADSRFLHLVVPAFFGVVVSSQCIYRKHTLVRQILHSRKNFSCPFSYSLLISTVSLFRSCCPCQSKEYQISDSQNTSVADSVRVLAVSIGTVDVSIKYRSHAFI